MPFESTARRRELGLELRAVRERAKLSGHDLERKLDWPHSKVSRGENGLREVSEVDAALFLGSCGTTTSDERERLLKIARQAHDDYWVRQHFSQLEDPIRSLIVQERIAEAILSYEPLAIPGLLQIEPYARAQFQSDGKVTEDRIDVLVQARMDRQRLLDARRPPRCTFFVHERALRSIVGDARVMQEQVLQLVLAGSLRHCSIRVVPESASDHRTLNDSCKIMEFAEYPAMAYAETYTASIFVEERQAVEAYYALFGRLDRDALNGGESRELLNQLASDYDRMEE
jgi:transcriptional regulator with XRE-family HTH domain